MRQAAVQPAVDEQERPGMFAGIQALFDPRGVWWSFLLLNVMFLAVTATIEGAHWVQEMPQLAGFAMFSLLVGLVLARLKVNQFLIHPLAIVVGLLMSAALVVTSAKGETVAEQAVDAMRRMGTFFQVIATNGINIDGLPFAAQIVLLTWFVGYFSSWFFYRHNNMWLGVLPAGIGLAINLTYVQGQFGANLAVYLFCALLLMMETHRLGLRARWSKAHVPVTELKYSGSSTPAVLFAGAVLSVAFMLPAIGQSVMVALAWEEATGPWRVVERQFDRLFASVSSGTVAPLHSFGRALPFKGAVNFGDNNPLAARLGLARDVVMYVKAEESGYWRAESYSEYQSGGWLSSNRVIKSPPRDSNPGALEEYKERKQVQQTIELVQPLDVIPFRGMPLYVTQPANGETSANARFSLDLTDGRRNGTLPPELQRAANDIRGQLQDNPLPGQGGLQRIISRSAADIRVEQAIRSGGQVVALEVSRTDPSPVDYASIRPSSATQGKLGFTIVSSVSKAPVEVLRQAPVEPPGWVRDQYLQMPASLPDRVKALSQEWTQGAGNTFDRALALESRLRDFPYNTNIPSPPRERDGVDFFLFDLKRGYADYHASAMTMMLRSLGIPARIAVGYVSGEFEADKERYQVREVHAHAWVEVFIPSYGWIDYNPTPNWPVPPRFYNEDSSIPFEDDPMLGKGDLGLEDAGEPIEDLGGVSSGSQQMDLTELARNLAMAGLLALGVWLLLRWVWGFGLRGLALPAQTYEKMCRLALLARVGHRGRQTPREYAIVLGQQAPDIRDDVARIGALYTRARYRQGDLTEGERVSLQRAWAVVRKELFGKAVRSIVSRLRFR